MSSFIDPHELFNRAIANLLATKGNTASLLDTGSERFGYLFYSFHTNRDNS